jgi:aryl-alcohol dehydrogenase-like predicted oxidoreductase
MEYTTLGRTGLRVSVAGLGCGGNSRLGLASGGSEAEAVAIVRRALALGVSLVDTAPAYGTEAVVGAALAEVPRDRVVISTKVTLRQGDELLPAAALAASIDASLRALRTDHLDIVHLHAVRPRDYDAVVARHLPLLLRAKEAGKAGRIGITESPPNDPTHRMLARALDDPVWEVAMVGFHLMSQSARHAVFPLTRARRVGTLLMFAVRSLFSIPGRLQATMRELAAAGRVPGWLAATDDPLAFLVRDGGAGSVIDAAYRYARHERGVDVVLTGTGDPAHLERNIESLLRPPLPAADVGKVNDLFGALEGIGLDLPIHRPGAG